ncbi:MAG: hypothetical protein AB7R40_22370 [Nitrospiraceae bacterium]
MASSIEQIKTRLKIEDVIGETFTVTGRGHTLTTVEHDSLKIEVNHQRWSWYSSRWQEYGNIDHGDIFDWYQLIYRCDLRQAIEDLAQKAGVELREMTPADRAVWEAERAERRTKAEILELATVWFEAQLWGPEDSGRRYAMAERGWTEETLRRERVGYNPSGDKKPLSVGPSPTPALPKGEGVVGEVHLSKVLREAGVMEHPLARAVLSLPAGALIYAHQERGQVVYLSARSVEGKRHYNLPLAIEINGQSVATGVEKRPYVNSPGPSAGSPSTSSGGGGRSGARVLVEGQGDAISLSQLGIDGVALCSLAPADVGAVSHVGLDNDVHGQAKALEMALGVDPLCRIIEWPRKLRHREDGQNYVSVKDAGDLTKGTLAPADVAGVLENSLTAIERLAVAASKAKDQEKVELLRRFFDLYEALDKMTATEMKPDLATHLGVQMGQFNRLLKVHKEEAQQQAEEKEFSEQHKISPGGFVGGYLFEQCVYELSTGEFGCYYWVRSPDGTFEKRQNLQIGATCYWPVDPREEELIQGRDVLFASDRENSGTEAELLRDIRAFIHYWLDVPAHYENIASYYVLLTWFYDAGYETIPYLRALGEYGSGKSRFINTIGNICFRPMLFGGGDSEATIYYTLETFKGTMVIDESDFKNSDEAALISKIINMGNNRRGSIKRLEPKPSGAGYKVKRFNVFGPKIFGAREGFGDQASDSRCLTHYTTSMMLRPDIPLDLTSDFDRQAQRLRNRLLDFRLKHWTPVMIDPNDVDRTIMARLAQITAALKSIIKDRTVIEELTRFVRLYNQSLIGDRQMTDPAIVVEAMVRIRYPRPAAIEVQPDWSIGNIAQVAQEIANDFDPELKMTPKRVGGLISRQLGIIGRDGRDTRGRNRIEIEDRELEGLMQRYGISKPEWVKN